MPTITSSDRINNPDALQKVPTEPTPELDSDWLRKQAPRWLVPVFTALSMLEALIVLSQAALVATLAFDALVVQAAFEALIPSLWLLLAVLLARGAVQGVRQWLIAGVSAGVRIRLRRRLLHRFSLSGIDQLNGTGQAATIFDEQIEALDGYYQRFLPQSISALVIPAVLIIAVFSQDWLAGLLLALAVPLIPMFMVLVGLGAQQLSETHYRSLAQLSGWFLDQVQGASTIRLFQAEAAALTAVTDRTEQLRLTTMRVLRVAFLSSAVLEFFSAVAIATLAIYVGMGLLGYLTVGPAESLTLASGLFVLLLAPEIFLPIRTLSQGWHDRADAKGALASIKEALVLAPTRPFARPDFSPAVTEACRIDLNQVDFAYPGRRPILRSKDLTIHAGERILLVGPSGCGKSTLIHLLAGFLQPQHGGIQFNGHHLAELSQESLVAHVSWLGQRPTVFSGTIAENIGMGWRDANREAIESMANIARVHEFAERMPEGLNAVIGEGGHGLSGGQAQRVALARALLRPCPVVLLDEPTASLDHAGEHAVLAAMDELFKLRNCTVVYASHRRAAMSWVDRIVEIGDDQWTEHPAKAGKT